MWLAANHTADPLTTSTSPTGDQMVTAGARVLSQPAPIAQILIPEKPFVG